jgi:hypothetical protein
MVISLEEEMFKSAKKKLIIDLQKKKERKRNE